MKTTLKKKTTWKIKTVPSPSLHNLSCAVYVMILSNSIPNRTTSVKEIWCFVQKVKKWQLCDQMTAVCRGGKRGGAREREHCSKKEMDRTILSRRIWAKFTILVSIFIKRAIYRTFLVGPMKNRSYFEILKSLWYMFISKEHILKYRKIPSAEGYKENE